MHTESLFHLQSVDQKPHELVRVDRKSDGLASGDVATIDRCGECRLFTRNVRPIGLRVRAPMQALP